MPDDAEEEAQQRNVKQIVNAPVDTVPTETVTAETESVTLDHESLDVTRPVERPPPRAKAAPKFECSLMRGVRLELERVRNEQQAKRRFNRAGTSASSSSVWVLPRGGSFGRSLPAVTYASLAPVAEYITPAYAVYAATAPVNEYVTSALPSRTSITKRCGWLS